MLKCNRGSVIRGDSMSDKRNNEPTANRVAKDSVFTDLFSDKRYLLGFYQALHPEDNTTTNAGLMAVTTKY